MSNNLSIWMKNMQTLRPKMIDIIKIQLPKLKNMIKKLENSMKTINMMQRPMPN